MAAKILVTRRFPASCLNMIKAEGSFQVVSHDSDESMPRASLMQSVSGVTAILCTLADKIDEEVLDQAGPALKVISTMSVGYSHIDIFACLKRNIRVGYTPDVLTEATADLALALTLSVCRRLPEAGRAVHTGEWTSWKPFWMTGKDLYGASVGIVGLGRIGVAIARRLVKGFSCNVSYHTRTKKADAESELGVTWKPMESLLSESDIIICIVALNAETRGMIDARALSLMRPDAVFINVSRGEVVDQMALVATLKERPDFRVGLDVTTPEPLPTDNELLKLPNCFVLPHIGSASASCRLAMADLTVQNALTALSGVPMPAEVPETAAVKH